MSQKYSIADLIDFISRLPGVGPRSARQIAISMLQQKARLMDGFAALLMNVSASVLKCDVCNNFDVTNPCKICQERQKSDQICIVASVGDLWNIEASGAFNGKYYIVGGYLSATSSIMPDDLQVPKLCENIKSGSINEVIFALGSTIAAQTTYYYILDEISAFIKVNNLPTVVTSLAFGIPMGSEIDYLDQGTISEAIRSRK